MTPSEVVVDRPRWMIPKGRTKNALAHDVPLSEPAMAIVKSRIVRTTIPNRGPPAVHAHR